ncbi:MULTISPECIES: FtsX-like permease family protein [unclassified Streptomyces]|uniref:FtsX-like permease family protein n=1 Tax=unclassified Streptomyces TaxID=2593676 RepID=UPI001BAFBDB2|nr:MULTISPECIES: FtsX-like permease family protein [unclassified Streptomyces]MDH6453863.1 putative ABC transport system permease protein [Streptomyces sp. SAI-119]MDH6495578.1 putative ABC transport system permease protein [Streptomyces sp. SAI-149]QUC57509.1 FtsX-like permease family protein [Streptomyces sp. A2-16]
MSSRLIWLRWSWRDLRQRWVLVLAIALTIALGTGAYAGFTGTADWRTRSYDASYAKLDMHDVRVTLTKGTTAPAGTLRKLVAGIPSAGRVTGAAERLTLPTQVDASHGGREVLVAGRLVGVTTGAEVDRVHVYAGRQVRPDESGSPVAVLERAFARYHDLSSSGTVRVSGGTRVRYVGQGTAPDYFSPAADSGIPMIGESGFAVLFVPLATAQRLGDAKGQVNEVVLTLTPGTDQKTVAGRLERALGRGPTPLSGTVTVRDDEIGYHALYEDINGDARFFDIIALLLLLGAAFGAFNLTSRVVEAQRREIGIGMALGVPRSRIAARPLLLGVQVALLGVALGLGVGAIVSRAMAGLLTGLLPLPVWDTPFQYRTFLYAALLGFALPLLAVAWPVWRAVRVRPVDAIRVGHLAARGGGLAPLLRRLPVPGRGYRQLPLRNVLRTPRRTALTALGIGAAVAIMVTVFGMLDSFGTMLGDSEQEATRGGSGRVIAQLDGYHADGSAQVRAVAAANGVDHAAPLLTMPATARHADHKNVTLLVEARDLGGGTWRPTLTAGSLTDHPGGLVLSEKAAHDLGVRPGDSLVLHHPRRSAQGTFTLTDSRVTVAALHPNPLRTVAYLDRSRTDLFGLAGTANAVEVLPTSGTEPDHLERALSATPGVTAVQTATETVDALRKGVEEFTGILDIAAGVTLALAVLIAFNAASISADERSRENATMFAFGLPVRTVLTMAVTESALLGALGTAAGILLGQGIDRWMVRVQLARTMPEIGFDVTLAPGTYLTALLLGIGAVALTPLLTARRLRRMNIPATLRVVE